MFGRLVAYHFDDEDLTGAQFRECDLSRTRLIGVVMQDAEIDGLVTNLTVNGIDVMPYGDLRLLDGMLSG